MIQEELLQKIRYIELKVRKKVESYLQGAYHTLFKGHGLEFQEVREYAEGDDARLIDWNVTARMNKPFIRLYREERELTVMLLVDVSASTLFGRSYSCQEIMATLAAAISFSAIRNNDKVGVILFSDRVEEYIPPRRGRNHLLTVIRSLLTTEPHGVKTDPEAAFQFLNKVMKKKCLIFFLSDMLFPEIPPTLGAAVRRHEIIPLGVYDKAQFASSGNGFMRIKNPETGASEIIDLSNSSEKLWNNFTEARNEAFKRLKMNPLWIENKEDFINDLVIGFKKMEKNRRA